MHRAGYGAPHAAIPRRTDPISPSPSPRFSPAPRAVNAALRHRVLPTANARPSSPPPELRTPRGEAPPLERGTIAFPPSHPCCRAFFAFPPTRSQKLGVLQRTPAGQDPRRGNSEQRGDRTLPVTGLAIVRPRLSGPYGSPGAPPVFPGQRGFQSPSAPCRLATTSAPACSAHVIEVCVPSMPWGDSHPLSHAQPLGFTLGALSGSPNRLALSPPRYVDCGRAEGCAPTRRVWCRASQDLPPARGSPGRGGRWRPPVLTSGPGATREVGHG